MDMAKIGVFVGSAIAGLIGAAILSGAKREPAMTDPPEAITCVDCGGTAHLISFLPTDEDLNQGPPSPTGVPNAWSVST